MKQNRQPNLIQITLSILVLSLSLILIVPTASSQSSLYDQAMDSLSQGEYEQAIQLLNDLSRTKKKQALQGKLKVYKNLGDNKNIVATIDELLRYSPKDITLKIEKAIALRNLGGWEKAETILEEIKDKIQDNPDYLVEYGRYLLWKKEFEQAKKAFDRALELKPDMPEALLGLSYYHVWTNQDTQALELVKKILEKNPDDVGALILQGWLLAWQEKFKESLESFDKALELAPNHPEIIRGIAQNYAWDGQISQSLEYYEWLLEIQPDNPDIMLQMGRLYRRNGQFKKAVDILTEGAAIDANRVDIQEELSLAKKWADNVDNNIRRLKQRISINQGNSQDFVTLGKAYNWLGELGSAKKTYRQALSRDPNNIQLMFGLAQVYEDLEEYERAQKLYEKILELKPDFVDASLGLQRIKQAFHPSVLFQYTFNQIRDFDPDLDSDSTVTTEHGFTLEYRQRLHSMYTLSVGYTFSLADEYDKFFDSINYQINHHTAYIQHDFDLPYNILLITRYDFHYYTNHDFDANFFNLTGSQVRHGGFLIVQVPHGLNTFSLQFSRSFFQAVGDFDLTIEADHTITLSEDVSIIENLSGLISVAGTKFSNEGNWFYTVTIHPRYNLSFFPQASVEYEFQFLTEPNRQIHRGIINLDFQIGANLQNQVEYGLNYFTDTEDFSHFGSLTLSWIPMDFLNFSLSGDVEYHSKDWIFNVVTSLLVSF